MKIALVTRGFSPTMGGAERVSVSLAHAFKAAGHEVTVFAEKAESGTVDGIKVVKVAVYRYLPSSIKNLIFNNYMDDLNLKSGYDAVLGLCQFYPMDVYRASGGVHEHWLRLKYPNAFFRALKYVFSPGNLVITCIERGIMARHNHGLIIVNSELVKGQMLWYYGLDEKEVRVVRNGIDHAIFNAGVKNFRSDIRKEFDIADNTLLGAYVSNNWERKGLGTIIKALAASRDAKIIVVGKGSVPKWQAKARSAGVPDGALVFAGIRKDVERFYGAADFFVLPTQYDPCSNATLEAMASGLPVVTTVDNGASEFVEDGVSGFVMKDWSDGAYLKDVIGKLGDAGLRDAMGRAAIKAVAPLSWEKTMSETLSACEEAAKMRGIR